MALSVGSNSSSLPPLVPPVSSEKGIQNLNTTPELYLDSNYTHLPGMTNLIYSPLELYHDAKALSRAYVIADREGMLEGSLRILQSPFTFGNAFLQTLRHALSVGVALNVLSHKILYATVPLSTTVTILGFALCSVGVVLEAMSLRRAVALYRKSYVPEIESLTSSLKKKDPEVRRTKLLKSLKEVLRHPLPQTTKEEINRFLEKQTLSEADYSQFSETLLKPIKEQIYLSWFTQFHQTHFQVSPEEHQKITRYVAERAGTKQQERIDQIIKANLEAKRNQLARRVHPWMVKRLAQSVPHIVQELQHPHAAIREGATKKADQLFKNMQIQTTKQILIHSTGLLALAFALGGLIAGYIVACPLSVFVTLVVLGTLFSFASYYMQRGYMDTEEWAFSVENCLPTLVKKYRQQEEPPPVHFTLPPYSFQNRRKERHLPRAQVKSLWVYQAKKQQNVFFFNHGRMGT